MINIYHHMPWLVILLVGGAFNWFWWMDTAIRPAVTLDPEKTQVVSTTRGIGGLKRGEPVLIRAYGTNHRNCPRTYQRILHRPDGVSISLNDGKGHRFIPGEEGWVQIEIDTHEDWPAGEYEFKSYGFFNCNPPFPKQVLQGVTAKFTLS